MGYRIQHDPNTPDARPCIPENAWPGFCMQDVGQRFYSPGTGRWLSRDPIAERGGANLCAFVGNNPASYADVLGMLPVGDPNWVRRTCDNACCDTDTVAEGRQHLMRAYASIDASWNARGIPRRSPEPWYSCDTLSELILGALDPSPACWICWQEERRKQTSWGIYNHKVVVCESLPLEGEGERIVFDYWQNRNGSSYDDFISEWTTWAGRDVAGSYIDCSGVLRGNDRADTTGTAPPPP